MDRKSSGTGGASDDATSSGGVSARTPPTQDRRTGLTMSATTKITVIRIKAPTTR
jgi:hypothetical protein